MVLPGLLAGLQARHPGIRLQVHIGDHEEVFKELRSGVTEVALTFDLGLTAQFHSVPLASLPPCAVVAAGHRLAAAPMVRLADLAAEDFILMDLPHTREYFLSSFHGQRIEPRLRYHVASFEAVRSMVGNGLGYSILNLRPRSTLTNDGTRVAHLALADNLRPLQALLLSMRGVARRRILHTFQDYARGYFKLWREEQGVDPGTSPQG